MQTVFQGLGGAKLPIGIQRRIALWLANEYLLFTCNLYHGGGHTQTRM